jgi:hypothetical protein
MKNLGLFAALMMTSTSAFAGGSYSFEIEGHRVRIETTRDCNSLSCVSVSIPGVYESGRRVAKRGEPRIDESRIGAPVTLQPSDVDAPSVPVETAQPRVEPAPSRVEPAPVASNPAPEPQPQIARVEPKTVAQPIEKPLPPKPVVTANTPLGTWDTEDHKGLVRIEQCGQNLCGYAVNAKTNVNAEKVLIDMRPAASAKWTGRIYDPNTSNTYDSSIAMKGSDMLRVQGCAFGGMFCGGQTWKRVS